MLTLIVEIIIGAFVGNFNSEEHPYILNFFKGMIVGCIGFVLGNIIDFVSTGFFMPLSDQLIFFGLSIVLGFLLFIFFSLFDFLFKY
ncbi:hypothetical protein G9F32_13610 [Acinetobacter sp. 194]|uniref:hypothetical protein n=1 Tax=Acinetobacter shaoyimingii TaxID=2715164 RepID=UPI00140E014E|nr:hypothetical protein [Acinetobacter shaoyimingii]NHB59042.1 hypothetical protein [Acinetobacter shaoyimingii]